jgi:hypothetical protein
MTDIPDEGQQILAVMPLHAISAVYGEQGLRTRLATETAHLGDAPSREKISEALELAGRLHASDRRQREPYVNHLLRVALRIICHYDVRDPDVICAALLHDAVEDHAGDLAATGGRPAALAELADRFGPQVAGRDFGWLGCYMRDDDDRVYETYWTTGRGNEAGFWSYSLLDRTVFGRQEPWEDSPEGWPKIPAGHHQWRVDGRPLAQWDVTGGPVA